MRAFNNFIQLQHYIRNLEVLYLCYNLSALFIIIQGLSKLGSSLVVNTVDPTVALHQICSLDLIKMLQQLSDKYVKLKQMFGCCGEWLPSLLILFIRDTVGMHTCVCKCLRLCL